MAEIKRTPIALFTARLKPASSNPHTRSASFLIARARANKEKKRLSLTEREKEFLSDEWEYQDEHQEGLLPKPLGELRHLLNDVTEIFIAGGGGGGRAYPSAIAEAVEFGLDLHKLKVVCASSVGTIVGLGITLGVPATRMKQILNDMPTDTFQDWSWYSFINFFTRWGWCQGEAMPHYFRQLIKRETGLDDPTFLQLYQAGYRKEFRIITSNVSKQRAAIFSYVKTPHEKVAKIVGLACSIPLVFPPQWIRNKHGKLEAHSDGGLANNFPFGVGSLASIHSKEQLGFIIINNHGITPSPHQNPLLTFWHYLRGLITLLFTQDPLCMAATVKDRTVPITVNHNPLNFNATSQEQAALDDAGRIGVRRFARHRLKKSNTFQPAPKMLSSLALRYRSSQARVEKTIEPKCSRRFRP
ncbi:MAG TPA: patatin-like phospholipase family protein [Candidatus Berkiella sp.]|nr:patatin-like phospholipase family protein [Candidatus Berkiella sp.]